MARYYGKLGFAHQTKVKGVVKDVIEEKTYKGLITRDYRSNIGAQAINDTITLSNIVSLVVDPYLEQNLTNLRYATFIGSKWKVNSIDINYPRVSLTLGSVYHG